jgi:hypothetical protein
METDASTRRILIETNVIDGNVAETFTFSQAETLHLDFVAYTANQKRIKMPEGGSCKMEAWIDGTPATLYVQKTGTVNTTTRKATITLSRAESNMPVGDYLFTVKVFDSDDLLTGIIARGTMTALYSPQTDSVDYVGTSPAISAHASTHATGGSDPVTAADVDPAGTAIAAALLAKADDNAVMHLAGTETASGLKKFSLGIWSGIIRAFTGGYVDVQNAVGTSLIRAGVDHTGTGGFATGIAEGSNTIASGNFSRAEGVNTTASGVASKAEGFGSTASGLGSRAAGVFTVASGDYSSAFGDTSTASGEVSFASGRRAAAIHAGSMVDADGQDADVASTTTNQRIARFLNGYKWKGGSHEYAGSLNPETDNIPSLGTTSLKWLSAWITTLNTGILKALATTGLVVQNSAGDEKLKVGASTGADVQVTGTADVSGVLTAGNIETTLTDDDAKIPSSGAVFDYSAVKDDIVSDPDFQSWIGSRGGRYSLSETQRVGVAQLVAYLKKRQLWSDTWLCPMMSAMGVQPSTNPSLGGWSTASVTWTGSPATNGYGVVFDGSTNRGVATITGLQDVTTLNTFVRNIPTQASSPDATFRALWTIGDSALDKYLSRATSTGTLTGETAVLAIKNATYGAGRAGTDDVNYSVLQDYVDIVEAGASGTQIWQDDTQTTIDFLNQITANTDVSPAATGTTSDIFNIGANVSAGYSGFYSGTISLVMLIRKPLSLQEKKDLRALVSSIETPAPLTWWGDSFTLASHSGFTDYGATTTIRPPTKFLQSLTKSANINFGASGETVAQIETRAIATDNYKSGITVIWGGTNDKDNADESAVADNVQDIIDHLGHTNYVIMPPLLKGSWTTLQNTNLTNIRTEYLSRWPTKVFDIWTECDHITAGEIDTGYLRYTSAGVEDDLHANDNFYAEFADAFYAWLIANGYL